MTARVRDVYPFTDCEGCDTLRAGECFHCRVCGRRDDEYETEANVTKLEKVGAAFIATASRYSADALALSHRMRELKHFPMCGCAGCQMIDVTAAALRAPSLASLQ